MIPKKPEIVDPAKYCDVDLPREKLEYALGEALKKIDMNLEPFAVLFPSHNSYNNVYKADKNTGGWNQGFWTGMLWHAYELTGNDDKYRNVALGQIPSYYKRIKEKLGVNHHDMGFLYTPSCVAAWKLDKNKQAKAAAIMAADHLITRYHPAAKFIQAWGDVNDVNSFRLIIDCLLNIPLLYWASEVTGDPKYDEMAYNHFNTTADVILRPDASTHHTYYFDPATGKPLKGVTAQGFSNDSAWSRGQAWGIYGPMLTYMYKHNDKAMEMFRATTNYFLNHLPDDYIAYWDLCFTDGDEPRDSSAAAIALCGMIEGVKHMDDSDPDKRIYQNAIKHIMNSLIDNYLTKDIPESNGLLLHAVYSKPHNGGVDECNIWGDYFYMEALHRLLDPDWHPYW